MWTQKILLIYRGLACFEFKCDVSRLGDFSDLVA